MSWFLRGVQSAIFHYASCAPCIQYTNQKKRQKEAKRNRKARIQQEKEQPGSCTHPGATGSYPGWQEEIAMGPGPPPRRAKRTNTSGQRALTISRTHSTVVSRASSSVDVNRADEAKRVSEDSMDDENWNRKPYQREDEYLWGTDEPISPGRPVATHGSSVGVAGISRPDTAKSSAESYYTGRAPPVNDLHPPIVSIPSRTPSDNHWMLQPPPKASVMAGKERATNRSRSGSGASSRVELSLQRQVSERQLKYKLDHGGSPEMPSNSRRGSYTKLVASQRNERPRTPHVRPPSVASSRVKKVTKSAARSKGEMEQSSSGESSSDTVVRRNMQFLGHAENSTSTSSGTHAPSKPMGISESKIVRVQSSRQRLSTVMSSGGDVAPPDRGSEDATENRPTSKHIQVSSSTSDESMPYLMKPRPPLRSSDLSSLNVLQDLVSPQALRNSRFVSTPLTEARIQLPPSDAAEESSLAYDNNWAGSGFGVSRAWGTDTLDEPVPFDSLGVPERDPRLRWSVDF